MARFWVTCLIFSFLSTCTHITVDKEREKVETEKEEEQRLERECSRIENRDRENCPGNYTPPPPKY